MTHRIHLSIFGSLLALLLAPLLAPAAFGQNVEFTWARPVGEGSTVFPHDLIVDPFGDVIVGGEFSGTVDFSGDGSALRFGRNQIGFVAKYSSDGDLLWVHTLPSDGESQVNGLAVDPGGVVFAVGDFSGRLDIDEDGNADYSSESHDANAFVAAFLPYGFYTWSRHIGGNTVGAQAVTWQEDFSQGNLGGRVLVTGAYEKGGLDLDRGINGGDIDGPGESYFFRGNAYVATYEGGVGNLLFAQRMSIVGEAHNREYISPKGIDSELSDTCVTGDFKGEMDFDEDGDVDLRSDSSGGGSREAEVFIVCFLPGPDPIVRGGFTHGNDGWDVSADLAMYRDDDGTYAYITGQLGDGSNANNDAFVAKYNIFPAGARLWQTVFGSDHPSNAAGGVSIHVDKRGIAYASGYFTGDLQSERGGPVLATSRDDSRDVFVVRFEETGEPRWVKTAGGSGDDGWIFSRRLRVFAQGSHMDVDGSGNVYVAGSEESDPMFFDDGDFSLTGDNNYLAKYSYTLIDVRLDYTELFPIFPLEVPGGIRSIMISNISNASFGDICDPDTDGECVSIGQQFSTEQDSKACEANGNDPCVILTYRGLEPLNEVLIGLIPTDPSLGEIGFGLTVIDDRGEIFSLPFGTYVLPAPPSPPDRYDIYTIETANGATERITFIDDRGEFNPDWSPDGTQIVHDVTAFAPDGTIASQDLYLTDTATGTSTPLAGGEGGNDAAWHPGGSDILFDRCPFGSAPPLCETALYRVPAAGGTPVLVRNDAVDGDWAHSGQLIVFHQPSDGSIRTRHLVSGQEELVTASGEHPVWSPDDKYIAYVSGGDVYRVRIDGNGKPKSNPEPLTTHPANDGQPSWAPSGSGLVFHSDRSGDFELYTVEAGGSPVFLAGAPLTGDFDPSYAPDGSRVAYAGSTDPATARVLPEASGLASEAMTHAAPVSASQAGLSASSYPNPFNPATTIRFTLPAAAQATVRVYDLLGRTIATLADGPFSAGTHAVRFEAGHLPSGTYFYRIEAGGESLVRQFTLMK